MLDGSYLDLLAEVLDASPLPFDHVTKEGVVGHPLLLQILERLPSCHREVAHSKDNRSHTDRKQHLRGGVDGEQRDRLKGRTVLPSPPPPCQP